MYVILTGARACDWQRNMLEQRMQALSQLMKECEQRRVGFHWKWHDFSWI